MVFRFLKSADSKLYPAAEKIANYAGAFAVIVLIYGALVTAISSLIRMLPFQIVWPAAILAALAAAILIMAVAAYVKNAFWPARAVSIPASLQDEELASLRQQISALNSLFPRVDALERSRNALQLSAREALEAEIALLREPIRRKAIRQGNRIIRLVEEMAKRPKTLQALDHEKSINRRQMELYSAASLCGIDLVKLTENISNIHKHMKGDVAYLQISDDEIYFQNGHEKRQWTMFTEGTKVIIRSLEDIKPAPNILETAIEKLNEATRKIAS